MEVQTEFHANKMLKKQWCMWMMTTLALSK